MLGLGAQEEGRRKEDGEMERDKQVGPKSGAKVSKQRKEEE